VGKGTEMTKEQERVKKCIDYLINYINTYDKQKGYLDYSDKIIIDDMLYGIGVALSPGEYQFASGYYKFKLRLIDHLKGINYDRPRRPAANHSRRDNGGNLRVVLGLNRIGAGINWNDIREYLNP